MTFKEFRESAIDYEKGYEKLLDSVADKDEGLEKAAYDCYRQYKDFCMLRDIRESKVAHKSRAVPLHCPASAWSTRVLGGSHHLGKERGYSFTASATTWPARRPEV